MSEDEKVGNSHKRSETLNSFKENKEKNCILHFINLLCFPELLKM